MMWTPGGDFRRLVDELDVRSGPGLAKPERIWWLPIEIASLSRQLWVSAIEGGGLRAPEHAEILLGREDLHAGVDGQEVAQSGDVVAVAVRDHGEIDCFEVDAEGLHVMREDVGLVAGIEQNPSPSHLHERCISPILPKRRILSEGVEKNRELHTLKARVVVTIADRRGWQRLCERNTDRERHEDRPAHP